MLFTQLSAFMNESETKLASFRQSQHPREVEAIRSKMQQLETLRHEVHEKAPLKEQLAQIGAELCAVQNQHVGQSAIRQSLAEMGQRWSHIYEELGESQRQLERSLLDLGQFTQEYGQLKTWTERTLATIREINPRPMGGLKHIEIELYKFRVIQNDIDSHLPSYEAIQNAGKAMIHADPSSTNKMQPMLDLLADNWRTLLAESDKLGMQLETERNEVSGNADELEKWSLWLGYLLNDLRTMKPIGGLPETCIAQIDEFRITQADVEHRRPQIEAELHRLEEHFANTSSESNDDWAKKQFHQIRDDWALLQVKLEDREQRLQLALEEAIELFNGMQEIQDWLQDAEHQLAMVPPISKLPDQIAQQLAAHSEFVNEVHVRREQMRELHHKGI